MGYDRARQAIKLAQEKGRKVVRLEMVGETFRLEYEDERRGRADDKVARPNPEQLRLRGDAKLGGAERQKTKAGRSKGGRVKKSGSSEGDPSDSPVGGERMSKRFAPWSYSKLKAFETCPKQFYHMKIAKTYEEPESEHLRYGNEFHKAAELYVKGQQDLPGSFDFARPALDALIAKPGEKLAEQKLGLTEDLEACGFFDKSVWWRGVVDLLIIDGDLAWVVDYKTGKSARYADKGQLELMAMATFKHFPKIKKVRAGLLFVIAKEMVKDAYAHTDQGTLWADWLKRYHVAEKAMKSNIFNPKPSGLCRNHCLVTECPHNGRS